MSSRITRFSISLAIAPSNRGFGFAVMEGQSTLVDWGVKTIKENKHKQALAKLKALISQYEPTVLVVQNYTAEGSRRSPRIQALGGSMVALATKQGIVVASIPARELRKVFFGDRKGTKFEIARILADRFPEELAARLPRQRKPWMSQDYRMDIFDAVGLNVAFWAKRLHKLI
jgi:Holliday junction resolvasome RuvABC endonuclease subunit